MDAYNKCQNTTACKVIVNASPTDMINANYKDIYDDVKRRRMAETIESANIKAKKIYDVAMGPHNSEEFFKLVIDNFYDDLETDRIKDMQEKLEEIFDELKDMIDKRVGLPPTDDELMEE